MFVNGCRASLAPGEVIKSNSVMRPSNSICKQRGGSGAGGPQALNNHCQNGVQLKPDLQHATMCLAIIFHYFFSASPNDLGLCHLFGSMWIKTSLECVKSNSATPEALMGKSWHLTVNEPLYSAGHLSQDQGLKGISDLALICISVQGWGDSSKHISSHLAVVCAFICTVSDHSQPLAQHRFLFAKTKRDAVSCQTGCDRRVCCQCVCERERAGQGGSEWINALCTALQWNGMLHI